MLPADLANVDKQNVTKKIKNPNSLFIAIHKKSPDAKKYTQKKNKTPRSVPGTNSTLFMTRGVSWCTQQARITDKNRMTCASKVYKTKNTA